MKEGQSVLWETGTGVFFQLEAVETAFTEL